MLQLLSSACQLDVLLFLRQHSGAHLTAEDVARRVGYPVDEVHDSLAALEIAAVIARSASHGTGGDGDSPVYLYEFSPNPRDVILPRFLWLACTPDGRRQLLRVLTLSQGKRGSAEVARARRPFYGSGPPAAVPAVERSPTSVTGLSERD
jgi:hypothetical protein